MNVVFASIGPTDCAPDIGFGPDQPLEAMQLVALALDHESCKLAPASTTEAAAASVTVGGAGGGAEPTVIAVVAVAAPPVPVQVSE